MRCEAEAEARRSRRRRLAGQARLPAGTRATASRAPCLPSFQTRTGSRASPGLAGPEAAPWGRALSGSERRSLFPGAATEAVAGVQGTDPSPGGFLGHGEAGPSPRSDCQGHLPSLPGPTRHQPVFLGHPPGAVAAPEAEPHSAPACLLWPCRRPGRKLSPSIHLCCPGPWRTHRNPLTSAAPSPCAEQPCDGLHCAPQSPTPQA